MTRLNNFAPFSRNKKKIPKTDVCCGKVQIHFEICRKTSPNPIVTAQYLKWDLPRHRLEGEKVNRVEFGNVRG